MESLIIFAISASTVIGFLFLYSDIWEEWSRCNVFGKLGIIALCLLGVCGIGVVIGLVGMFVCMCYLADVRKIFLKKEFR